VIGHVREAKSIDRKVGLYSPASNVTLMYPSQSLLLYYQTVFTCI